MYKVLKDDLPALRKKINAIGRKLDKHGLTWRFEITGESVEPVNVYRVDGITLVEVDKCVVDVVSYTFDMEKLKLGDWRPVAVIEHMALTRADGVQNMVHSLGEDIPLQSWWTIDNACEHCNHHRQRNKTVMLQDDAGEYKQVGTTCIRDFTGIDGADVVAAYSSINDIIEIEPRIYEESYGSYAPRYVSTLDYLAHAIDIVSKNGYNKMTTKAEAFAEARQGSAKPEHTQKAQAIISFFADYETEDGFCNNVKSAVTAKYSKISGLVAFAPIVYQEIQEFIEKQRQREIEAAVSQWQGSPGDKVILDLKHTRSFSYESDYGRYGTTMFIHLFKDEAGNVYKWNTSKGASEFISDTGLLTLKGTIKEHSEYKGEKQTVLTRCKAI